MKPYFVGGIRLFRVNAGWFPGESFKLFSLELLSFVDDGFFVILDVQVAKLCLLFVWG